MEATETEEYDVFDKTEDISTLPHGVDQLQLTAAERICLAAVLEDAVDQLAILGRIMPTSFQGQAGAPQVRSYLNIRNYNYTCGKASSKRKCGRYFPLTTR